MEGAFKIQSKGFFIIFEGPSINQMTQLPLEGQSPTLKPAN